MLADILNTNLLYQNLYYWHTPEDLRRSHNEFGFEAEETVWKLSWFQDTASITLQSYDLDYIVPNSKTI